MASALDQRRQLFTELLGRNLGEGDVNAVGGEEGLRRSYGDAQEAGQYNEIINSPEYLQRVQQQATNRYKPQYDLGLQGLSQQETDIARDFDRLGTTLKEQASKSSQGLQERYNQLGLLQSGLTAAGLGDIQKNLNQKLGESEQDRASRLASLALQRAGLTTQYTQNVGDAVSQMLGVSRQQGTRLAREAEERQRRQMEYEQQQAAQAQELAFKALDYSLRIPRGQRVEIPGYGIVEGLAEPKSSGGRSSGGRTSSRSGSGLTATQERSVYNQALKYLEDADIMTAGTQDRFLSAEEIATAQDQISGLANQYGIDPQQLWDMVWNENNFQEYIPDMYGPFKTYGRVTKPSGKQDSSKSDKPKNPFA